MTAEREVTAGQIGGVVIQDRGDLVLVRIRGEIDLSNYEIVRRELARLTPESASQVIVDLRDADYLDSAGVGLLFELATRLRGSTSLALIAPESSPARRVLQHVAMDQMVPIYESAADVERL